MSRHLIRIGSAFAMPELGDGEVSLVVTSPPYWQLKDYGAEGQAGFNDGWDRYVAPHWWAADAWAREHPDDPDAAAVRAFAATERAGHLAYGRRYLGWGVFVLRPVP